MDHQCPTRLQSKEFLSRPVAGGAG